MTSLNCIVLRGCGLEAHVSRLGATLVKLLAPGRGGEVTDLLLGYDSAEEYAKCSTYFGSVVGRCANRVAKGEFSLDGKAYQLARNNGANALHGGPSGFHTRHWTVEALLGPDGQELPYDTESQPAGVRLAYTSADAEEGYPGQLTVSCTYLLRSDNGSGAGGGALTR